MAELEAAADTEIPAVSVILLLGWSLVSCKCDVLKLFRSAESAVLMRFRGKPSYGFQRCNGENYWCLGDFEMLALHLQSQRKWMLGRVFNADERQACFLPR